MKNSETALELLKNGYNCSQAVLSACIKTTPTGSFESTAIASAFGAGIARLQLTCGAVSGALMTLGVKYFDPSLPFAQAKANVYEKTLEFIKKFTNRHGSIECITLLGANMHTDEGKNMIQEQQLYQTRCTEYVRSACEILEML